MRECWNILVMPQVSADKARAILGKDRIVILLGTLRYFRKVAHSARAMTATLVIVVHRAASAISVIRENERVSAD